MRNAMALVLTLALPAALGGCGKQDSTDQNVAIDINNADPSEIEAVPADETSGTPTDQLDNGADNADTADLNDSTNAD